jgi:ribose transport system ATP-binding protein
VTAPHAPAEPRPRGAAPPLALATGTPLLEVEGVSKQFGGTRALDDVSLGVQAGAVLALCGANGAGKSTLVRILAGVEHADHGVLRMDRRPVTIASPQDASRLGLRFIHQELHLVPKFTAAQNMALDYDGASRRGVLRTRAAAARAQAVMGRLQATFPLDVDVERLPVSDRWMVSLGRALMQDARLIVMDEPTASFTEEEAERLFAVIEDLTASGVAVLYISHRLDEVLRISREVTILRNGRLVGTFDAAAMDRVTLTREIVGGHVEQLVRTPAPVHAGAEVVLEVAGLRREPRVRGVDLQIRRGEMLGLAGLVGAGRTELARLLAGADAPTRGEMCLDGRRYAPRSPFDALRRGVALVPEERRAEGLLLRDSLATNVSLATLRRNRRRRLPLLSVAKARRAAHEAVERFSIKAASVDQPVAELSGGNQQKTVVGRFVRTAPRVLILDEPTAGVDVGARAEMHRLIRELADAGTAVLVISSDFAELAICERVAVMRDGRIAHVIEGREATKERLTSLCFETKEDPR